MRSPNRVLGNIEPDREIERRPMTLQESLQTLRLRNGARKTVENETMRAVQPQPVFDQVDDDLVGNRARRACVISAVSNPSSVPRSRLPPQDRAR